MVTVKRFLNELLHLKSRSLLRYNVSFKLIFYHHKEGIL